MLKYSDNYLTKRCLIAKYPRSIHNHTHTSSGIQGRYSEVVLLKALKILQRSYTQITQMPSGHRSFFINYSNEKVEQNFFSKNIDILLYYLIKYLTCVVWHLSNIFKSRISLQSEQLTETLRI